jgi:hypothetical protein
VPETGPAKSGEDPQSTAALATRRRESLVELRARVAALESEQVELLEKLAFNLDVENGELRTTNLIDTPLESGSRVRKESMSPSYLARALIQLRTRFPKWRTRWLSAIRPPPLKARVKVAFAACRVLRQLSEDSELRDVLMSMQCEITKHQQQISAHVEGAAPDGSTTDPPFRDVEISLLRIAGLTERLAHKHVDNAIAAFKAEPTSALARMTNPVILLRDLARLPEATCQSADLLSQGLRQERSRQRWIKILTFGVGGTFIVAANAAGTALLGPLGVAASGAVGSAAIGTGVQFLS